MHHFLSSWLFHLIKLFVLEPLIEYVEHKYINPWRRRIYSKVAERLRRANSEGILGQGNVE